MCGAAKITVVETEELYPEGALNPNEIHIPGIFVDRLYLGSAYEKRIEKLTVQE